MSSPNIAKSALFVIVSEIIFNLSGFLIHSALGRVLGPADYGRYGIIVTLTTMVIILIGNGIPTAMAKYISEYFETNARMVKTIKRQAVILQTVIIGTITILFFLSSPLLSKMLGDPTLIPLFRISTLIIPAFAAASFYFSYYTGLHRFNLQAAMKTLRSVFRIGFVIALAYFFGVKGSIIGYVIAPGSVFVVAYLIDKLKVSKELAKQNQSEESSTNVRDDQSFHWKKLINYAWQVVVFFLAYELLISIDLYLVKGILRDDRLTGIYNASLTVGRIPYYIFYAMTVFLLPMVSKSTSQNNHKETDKILSRSLKIMLILLVPMIILMSVFSKPIIEIFYGAKYLEAVYPMSILVFGVGFLTVFYVMSFAMNGAGKIKISMAIATLGMFLNAILNYFLIKKYSIAGSAIATFLSSFAVMLLMLYYLYRDYCISIRIKNYAAIIFAGVVTYYLASLFSKGVVIFFAWSTLLFGFYVSLLYLLGEIKKEDIAFIKNIVSRKKAEEVEKELSGNEPGV